MWTLRVPQGMEDAVRVRYIKASLEVEKDEWGRGKSVKLRHAHTSKLVAGESGQPMTRAT